MESATPRKKQRKLWLMELPKKILAIKQNQYSYIQAKKTLQKEFKEFESFGEKIIRYILISLFIVILLLGIYFGYATLMWEAHVFNFEGLWLLDISMIAFIVLSILWILLACIFWDFCWDNFQFNKKIYENLEGNFYIHFLRYLLILLLIGFLFFIIFVFIVSYQIANFYDTPWNSVFLEILDDIFD